MRMYDVIMKMPSWRKEILIQFGFSEVDPKEVEQWIYQKYPDDYKELKQGLAHYNKNFGNSKVVPFRRETMTIEERTAMLDLAEDKRDLILHNIVDEIEKLEK